MLIMSATELNKTYGTDIIFDGVSFSVNKNDRIGIVGPNGAGKTTLLKILAGELKQTSGNVFIRNGYVVGYLKQKENFSSDGTVTDEVEKSFTHFYEMEKQLSELSEAISDTDDPAFDRNLEKYSALMEKYKESGGYSYKSEMNGVLTSMGFGENVRGKKISMLSGGERTRLALACMLLRKPDILMMDEPTNHLDLVMLDWLEQYLKGYRGTIIVVSHDRFFLDRIVNRIFDMRSGSLTAYRGNYSEYLVKREEKLEADRRVYEKQQKEIAKQEEIIRRFKQHNTEHLVKRAQSREKKLEKIDRVDRPKGKDDRLRLSFSVEYKSGNDVIMTEDLSKSFGSRKLFSGVTMDIKKGEHICVIGENGVGKTTLLRIIMGLEKPDDGYLKIGHNATFGYYDQGQLLLDENETVLGEMKNAYHLYTDTEMRSLLGRFLFRGDDVFKQVSSLSGGEKAKLSLLKLMLSGANTLILDEPTNHLDIESKEVVEEAIRGFEGTMLIVSHDRYLLNSVPDRIFELTDHGMREYKGKFDYYLEKSAAIAAEETVTADNDEAAAGSMSAEDERILKKEQEAEERRRTRRIEDLEKRIHELEEKIERTEAEMCLEEHATDVKFLRESSEAVRDDRDALDDLYDEWLGLQ
jgi:ATP-binding cassette subfamily F protein 3